MRKEHIENKIKTAVKEFEKITKIKVKKKHFKNGIEHTSSLKKLPEDFQGVYIFYNANNCLKVGRAGPGSNARWVSNHYYSYPGSSTLCKSIFNDKKKILDDFPEVKKLNQEEMGEWIKKNLSRCQLIIPAHNIEKDRYSLNLLESLVQFHLEPIYEGRSKKVK